MPRDIPVEYSARVEARELHSIVLGAQPSLASLDDAVDHDALQPALRGLDVYPDQGARMDVVSDGEPLHLVVQPEADDVHLSRETFQVLGVNDGLGGRIGIGFRVVWI